MKQNTEKQKDILLNSFNVLKGKFTSNEFILRDAVGKMISIDLETAIEMWTYLLKENIYYVRDPSNGAVLTHGIYLIAASVLGIGKTSELIFNNDILKHMIFKHAAEKGFCTVDVIMYFINNNELDKANELIELVYSKKGRTEVTFDQYLEHLIDNLSNCYFHDYHVSEQGLNLLLFWVEKVKDPDEKARINISLVGLMSEK